jgi:hypothetical protein
VLEIVDDMVMGAKANYYILVMDDAELEKWECSGDCTSK